MFTIYPLQLSPHAFFSPKLKFVKYYMLLHWMDSFSPDRLQY